MNHKKVLVTVIAILLVLCLSLLASGQSLMQHMGEQDRLSEEDGDMIVIAFIQGEEYAVNAGFLKSTSSYYEKALVPHDEAWVREFFVAHEVLYREAQAQNLSASPEEVDQYIASMREEQRNTPETYNALLDYLKGRGMTEDEYWEKTWGLYQKQLSIEKLGEKLNDEYFSQHPDASASDYDEYYNNEYQPLLFDKYQVEML